MSTIGERLKKLREDRNLSQTEVAKLLGINRTTYVHYETGYSKPTQKLKELCALFNTTSDYIMGTNNKKISSNNIVVTEHEREFLMKYRQLSEKSKIKVEARLDAEYDMMKEREYTESQDA